MPGGQPRASLLRHQSSLCLKIVLFLLFVSCLIMVSSGNQANHSTKGNMSNRQPVPNDNEISQEWMFLPVVHDEVVHIKISSKSVKLDDDFSHLKEKLVYQMRVHPGVGPLMSVSTCLPVIVTELNDNDSTFKPLPLSGIHVTQPFSVLKTRVSDYRNATFIFKFEDETCSLVATAAFSCDKWSRSQDWISLPLESPAGLRIGSFTFDFVVIQPFRTRGNVAQPIGERQLMPGTAVTDFNKWSCKKVIHSGHRGLGVGIRNDIPGKRAVTENTIYSFNYAGSHGADMVELDVSLTKDQKVIVYHDLQVVHRDTKVVYEIADLTHAELLSHKYQPVQHDTWSSKKDDKSTSNRTDPDLEMFPLLQSVLQRVSPGVAINIEVKYPYPTTQDGSWKPTGRPWDPNEYLDIVLSQTFAFAGNRSIVFSSFGVDICSALSLKQTKFPVMLLTRNQKYSPESRDLRQGSRGMGVRFAAADRIHGVNCYADYILSKGPAFVSQLHDRMNLIVYTWKGPLEVTEVDRLIEMNVDGICYDKVDLKKPLIRLPGERRGYRHCYP